MNGVAGIDDSPYLIPSREAMSQDPMAERSTIMQCSQSKGRGESRIVNDCGAERGTQVNNRGTYDVGD